MGSHFITKAAPRLDAIDRVEWHARVSTDFYGTLPARAFALAWDGVVAFYREPVPSNGTTGADHPKRTLVARWTNQPQVARLSIPTQVAFEFATDLPGTAVDRIERFRDGGDLFVRVEGFLTLVLQTDDGTKGWSVGLNRLLGDPGHASGADIRTEPLDFTNGWAEVCRTLRPSGKYVID